MINNVAKTLLSCVDKTMPMFASDMYLDIEVSPKVKEIFCEIQNLMNGKTSKHLISPISSRFLQMNVVACRLMECMDFLTVYYYGYLTEEEKTKHRFVLTVFTEACIRLFVTSCCNMYK
ncbi:hypothetical protein DPMN_070480 [Dreissena polymorpha]|uniref:Uncharacterized protein n=1 Tax=Dreissena polymorpha TaxID=45954 RepID=A0A9D3Z610_DREPO|nr:hypothetical protein DPMN_070480 [Dreissena polymorpha]